MAAELATKVSEERATPAHLRAQTEDGSPDGSGAEDSSAPAAAALETNGDSNVASLADKLVDDFNNSTEVSISGSDTEASRHDHVKPDDKGHSRTSSTKRPATFKSVSVNKTFLASKVTSGTSVPKGGEKPTTPVPSAATLTSTSSTPKPRLVAKSAGGLRDASKSALSQNGRPAPNASAVWNKNQPVPVPDPKKFTDEELAKIGIHMASRLHADDTKGQSNWADIDEDDEDWDAPDAFTWSDGTKTTIPHVDETPTISEQPVVSEPKAVENTQLPVPSSVPLVPVATSPAVKPGLPSGKGLILKGGASSEKPTLVAKPPAPPTPVKSPWAALPPVTKASPMEGPPDQAQRGFGSPNQAYVRGGPPPAAREIAADDFSRSPRGQHQQLFNSQSGRYEPVPDRRGVPRTDYHQRGAAVLQRPMHSDGPAEPSAAFQTTHSSGGYGRRRGSSNLSGGSGSFQRPMGFDQAMPSEALDARRSSLISENSTLPSNYPASGPQAPPRQSPVQARASPAVAAVVPQQIPDAETATMPQPNIEDTVEFQKKLMQDRRTQAIKRRQEEEAKEEAEKKERLAKKLAALGPPPERRGTKKDESKEEIKTTTEPSNSGAKASQAHSQVANDNQPSKGNVDHKSGPNGVAVGHEAPIKSADSLEKTPATENKHGHPWTPSQIPPQPEPTIWGSNIQAPARNVWGAPNNDRTLGNGSFNAGFDAHPSQTAAARGGRPGPGPIGPPRGGPSQARPSTSRQLGPIGPPRASAQDVRQNRNRFTEQVLAGDNQYYAEAGQRNAALAQDLAASGLDYADVQPQIQEQFIERDENGNAIRRQAATYGSSTTWPAPSVGRQDERSNLTTSHSSSGPSATATVSVPPQSRFFPSGHNALQPEPLAPDTGRPPEEESHPAFDGDARHPHVSLPREKPLVKFPPPVTSAQNANRRSSQTTSGWGQQLQPRDDGRGSDPASRPAATTATSVTQGDKSQSMVDRIHALLRTGNEQPSSVNSSSRQALAHHPTGSAATVSLPAIYAPPTIVDTRSYVTKTMDEDCFEEQEMGSLPAVHIPSEIPEAAYNPAKAPPRQDRRLVQVVPTSVEVLAVSPDARNAIVIHLPDSERKTVPLATRSPNPRRGGRSNSRYSSSSYRGNRGQESSTPYEQSSPSGTSPGNGRGRGRGYRGRGNDWNRASAPAPAIQTQ